mgnify:CR=1 FL=1
MASYSFIGWERVQHNQIILQDLILPNRLEVHAYFLGKLTNEGIHAKRDHTRIFSGTGTVRFCNKSLMLLML